MAAPFQHLFRALLSEPPPGLACEFTRESVAVARWIPGSLRPERVAVRELPPDALRPQPLRENLRGARRGDGSGRLGARGGAGDESRPAPPRDRPVAAGYERARNRALLRTASRKRAKSSFRCCASA